MVLRRHARDSVCSLRITKHEARSFLEHPPRPVGHAGDKLPRGVCVALNTRSTCVAHPGGVHAVRYPALGQQHVCQRDFLDYLGLQKLGQFLQRVVLAKTSVGMPEAIEYYHSKCF